MGIPVDTLPDVWCYRVSAGTGRPGVRIYDDWVRDRKFGLQLLSVAARTTVRSHPSLRYTSLWALKLLSAASGLCWTRGKKTWLKSVSVSLHRMTGLRTSPWRPILSADRRQCVASMDCMAVTKPAVTYIVCCRVWNDTSRLLFLPLKFICGHRFPGGYRVSGSRRPSGPRPRSHTPQVRSQEKSRLWTNQQD